MQNGSVSEFSSKDSWVIMTTLELSIKQKIAAAGIPLKEWDVNINRGVITGYNEAFIISAETKDSLIKEDPRSAEIIRPILRGRDIKRYGYEWAGLWLIATFPSRQYDIDDYPAVKNFLLTFGVERLEQTGKKYVLNGEKVSARKKTNNKWFETQDAISYWDDLAKQKIIWGEISDKPKFAIDVNGEFCPEATTFLMTGDHLKYLLCFLNSTFSEYFFAKYGTTTGMGTLRWKKYLIELLPIPRPSAEVENEFNSALDNLLSAIMPEDIENCTRHINHLVYSTIGLTNQEIETVERIVAEGAH